MKVYHIRTHYMRVEFSLFVVSFYFLNRRMSLANLSKFANDILQSDRMKLHIKQLDNMEIGEQYHLLESYKMTNLDVIWIDTAKQRSRICYPITVQYIHDCLFYDRNRNSEERRSCRLQILFNLMANKKITEK